MRQVFLEAVKTPGVLCDRLLLQYISLMKGRFCRCVNLATASCANSSHTYLRIFEHQTATKVKPRESIC